MIDATESLATIKAVDNIDPYRRRSNPDRTLLAMGVSNGASSLLGGLTIIPGMVKSTANVLAGGRTQWANFYNACSHDRHTNEDDGECDAHAHDVPDGDVWQ